MRAKHVRVTTFFVAVAALVAACDEGPLSLERGRREASPETDGGDPTDPALCTSRPYVGLGGGALHEGRVVARIGVDRARVKPFSALATDLERVVGSKPASLRGAAATFGAPPERWYEEPRSSAVAIQTAFSIAFDACLDRTASAPDFAGAPTAASAAAQCSGMARAFWSKTPSSQEIEACTAVALEGTTAEADPRRRWAYVCASILTAAGFLSY